MNWNGGRDADGAVLASSAHGKRVTCMLGTTATKLDRLTLRLRWCWITWAVDPAAAFAAKDRNDIGYMTHMLMAAAIQLGDLLDFAAAATAAKKSR
jgi:hypothetical protein